MVSTTVVPLMTEIVFEPSFDTYTSPFAESNAMSTGLEPTETVATTVVPLITEIVFDPSFDTYTSPFAESNAMPSGFVPTEIVATTVLDEPSITAISCEQHLDI